MPAVFVALEPAEFFLDELFAPGVGFGVAGGKDVVGSEIQNRVVSRRVKVGKGGSGRTIFD